MPSNNMEADIKKVTAGNWVAEEHDWILIFDICSRVTSSASAARPAFQGLMKRLRNGTPEVQHSALVVLEALSSNCGKAFQLELCSREFYDAVFSLWRKRPHPNVLDRLRSLIEELTAVFANDSSLAMMQKLYQDLKAESFPFSAASAGAPPPSTSTSAPPQSSNSLANKEQDDLSRAIALSLKESSTSSGTASSSQFPPQSASSSLYPALQSTAPAPQALVQQVGFKARALYDFQSEDDNEISFKAGELINVLDSTDENWWSGSTLSGSGMFPASFVTRDLTVTPEPELPVQKSGTSTSNKSSAKAKPKPEIREAQIDLLLDMLNNADAQVANEEEEGTLKELEGECNDMKPLIADKISVIDRERLALQDLNDQFQAALAFYQQLMKETAYGQAAEHAESAPPVPTYTEEYGQAIPAASHHHQQQQQQPHTAAAPMYQSSPPVTSGYYAPQAPAPHQQAYAYQPPQQQQQPSPHHHQPPPPQQQQQHHHHHQQQQPPPQQQQQQQQQHGVQHGYQEQRFPPQQESNAYFPASGQAPVAHHAHGQHVQAAPGHAPYSGAAESLPYHALPPSQVMPDGSLL